MSTKLLSLFAFTAAIVFAGCESNHLFKSEKKIKKDIIGKWDMIVFRTTESDQNWIFTSDSLYILKDSVQNGVFDTIDVITYKIDATLSAPYLIVDGLTIDLEYNKKWTITQLDTKVFAIACDYKEGGVLQKEFVKR
jgi:hypothetical protein